MGDQNKNNGQGQQQDINQLLKVRREKLANLQEAGKDPFVITKYDQTYHTEQARQEYIALEEKLLVGKDMPDTEGMEPEEAKAVKTEAYNERRAIMDANPIKVSIAGRMMSKRVMGKASFCNIQDKSGNIQVFVSRDELGTDDYADFKKLDVGDIIGVTGYVFRTMMGEVSVHADTVTLLSKSLQILPEKFHGLTNTDIRYRQRYVDLIMNTDVKETFIKRSKIISTIRRFLDDQGFMEVETPMLVSNAGGAAARPFETHSMLLMKTLSFVYLLSFTLRDLSLVVWREYTRLVVFSVTRVLIHVITQSSHLWSSTRHLQIIMA